MLRQRIQARCEAVTSFSHGLPRFSPTRSIASYRSIWWRFSSMILSVNDAPVPWTASYGSYNDPRSMIDGYSYPYRDQFPSNVIFAVMIVSCSPCIVIRCKGAQSLPLDRSTIDKPLTMNHRPLTLTLTMIQNFKPNPLENQRIG